MEWGDTKRLITMYGKFPIRKKFILVKVDPDLDHSKLTSWFSLFSYAFDFGRPLTVVFAFPETFQKTLPGKEFDLSRLPRNAFPADAEIPLEDSLFGYGPQRF